MKIFCLFLGLLWGSLSVRALPANPEGRPFRLGYYKINPAIDRDKPLAALDGAGFAINSGILVGSFDEKWTVGISLASLKPLWWAEQKSSATTPPGSFGSAVVMGYRNGTLVKFDAISGKAQWTQTLDSFSDRPLTLLGNTLYVVTSAQAVYAIDFQTGRINWVFDGGFPDGLVIRSGPRALVYEGKVLVGLASGEILALASDSGKLLWRYNPAYNDARFHAVVSDMAVISGKLLIARYDGIVAAIDLSSSIRQVVWQDRLPVITAAVQRGERFYVGSTNGEVYAIDPASSGRKIWSLQTGASVTSMQAGEDALFVAGRGGQVTAIDWKEGAMKWVDQVGSTIATPPVIYEDVLYVATGYASIYGYGLKEFD